jgi:uncharacterized membrane protein YjjP (DUF1212 family)
MAATAGAGGSGAVGNLAQGLTESPRPPLSRTELADVVDLALWVGQLLMENGAESQRVEQSVRAVGVGLGCDWGNVLVSHNALMVTHVSGADFRTKLRRIHSINVDMSLIEAMSHVVHRVQEGKLDRHELRQSLTGIAAGRRHYGRGITCAAIGLACASFCRLFGGDLPAFATTLAAAALGVLVRYSCRERRINGFVAAVAAALAAGGVVGVTHAMLGLPVALDPALAASVLLLVPGVPAINSVEDVIKGHLVVGLARATTGILTVLAAAIGLILAMRLTGVGR